jgi:hypothetical protein
LSGDETIELADQYFETIPNAILSISNLSATTLGITNPEISAQLKVQTYPNPFDYSTNIVYTLPSNGNFSIDLYNTVGEKVSTLVKEPKLAGDYSFRLDATNLAPGMYSATLRLKSDGGEFVRTIRLICTH